MNDLDPTSLTPASPTTERGVPHSSHWGAFSVRLRGGDSRDRAAPARPRSVAAARQHPGRGRPSRAHRPADDPPRLARTWPRTRIAGVAATNSSSVAWPRALDLAAAELRRVYAQHGPRGVFGGSYGWASAGRFHDAQQPDPSLSEPRRRLCPLGQQLQLGCRRR